MCRHLRRAFGQRRWRTRARPCWASRWWPWRRTWARPWRTARWSTCCNTASPPRGASPAGPAPPPFFPGSQSVTWGAVHAGGASLPHTQSERRPLRWLEHGKPWRSALWGTCCSAASPSRSAPPRSLFLWAWGLLARMYIVEAHDKACQQTEPALHVEHAAAGHRQGHPRLCDTSPAGYQVTCCRLVRGIATVSGASGRSHGELRHIKQQDL